jgi:hypothetical protein
MDDDGHGVGSRPLRKAKLTELKGLLAVRDARIVR